MKRGWIKTAFILFLLLMFCSCVTAPKGEKEDKESAVSKEKQSDKKSVKESAVSKEKQSDMDSAEDFYNSGMKRFEKGDFDEAISDFQTAVKVDEKYYKAYYALGQANEKVNKPKEAEEAYEGAIKIKSDYLPALEALGLLCFHQKRYLEAEKSLKPARMLNSKVPEVYYAFGEIEQRENECKFAQILFKQALKLNPDYLAAKNGLAVAEQACRQKQQQQQQRQQQQQQQRQQPQRSTTPPRN